ncbi:hypothetical protein L6R52_42315, partial [Myxococcota bacterium]|nr:hypothetical protein [Myxococcota bacterium]
TMPARPRTAAAARSRVRLPREALTVMRTKAVRASEGRAVSTSVRDGRGTVSLFVGASDLPSKTAEVTVPSAEIASLTYVATDRQGRIFVRLETLEAGETLRVRRFVRVYDRELVELTTFEYPLEGVLVPEKDLDVDDAGNVFVLLPYADRVQVVRYQAP